MDPTLKEIAIRLSTAWELYYEWNLIVCGKEYHPDTRGSEKEECRALQEAGFKLAAAGKFLAHHIAYQDGLNMISVKLFEFDTLYKKFHPGGV